MKKQTLFIVLLILTLALSACGANSELDQNREKWDSSGVSHYRFELTISCFCPFMDIIPVVVEVKDGKILSMTGADGKPLTGDFRATFEEAGTVEALFAVAQANLAEADEVLLLGTTMEVTPVVRLDDLPVGDGGPGPVAAALLAALRRRACG